MYQRTAPVLTGDAGLPCQHRRPFYHLFFMTPTPVSFDAIVVGTGPGGAGVARELARAGSRVLTLVMVKIRDEIGGRIGPRWADKRLGQHLAAV